jgi:hypothetical protein|nr:MAG TPA: zipper dimerization domain transcription factor-like protein [Caudoviricetes sp.]
MNNDINMTWEERQEILHKLDSLYLEIKRYDYIGIKIATGVATIEDYAEQIAHMEELRTQIRELEAKIKPNN